MQDSVNRALLKTLIYSDLFDYPLLENQLWTFLIGKKVNRDSFEDVLKNLPKRISFRDSFYYLSGREQMIKTRLRRTKESQKKIVIAKKIIKQLHYIPTIQFIGISGALSLENSERDGDIDLFVITSKGTLWLTRLTLIILLIVIGRYRRRNQRRFCDKICLNMLIDESVLCFPLNRQDLYTAHEIVQLLPLFERNNMYERFMIVNKWVEKFLPNSVDTKILRYNDIKVEEKKTFNIFISIFEWLAKTLQLWSIKKHITTETILDNFLAFHPLDYKNKVLSEYKRRLKQYEI